MSIHPIIIIPVYNARESLLKLLNTIHLVSELPILIIDDGSIDGLSEKDLSPATYLKHGLNRGKGAALKTALTHARKLGFSHAVTLDADGQHAPESIRDFLALSSMHSRALVVGKRDLINNAMPFHRKLSNNITSQIISLRTGNQIHDVQVGYRCYPLNDSRLWDSIEDGFQFETAVFFNVARLRMKLIWQPIPVIYGNEASHMNLILDTIRFVRTFFRSFKC